MPRILRIINRLNLGGPTYNAVYLTKYLSKKYETLLVAGMKDETEASSLPIAEEMGITPYIIEEMKREVNPELDLIAYKKIKAIIKDFKPDIVHTHAAKAGAVGRLAAYWSDVPVILHTFHGHVLHSYFNPIKSKIFIEIEKFLAKKSTKIIALSPKLKYELCEKHRICKPEKIEIVPLGFDLAQFQKNQEEKRVSFRNTYKLTSDEIAIGIIGRIVAIKNLGLFLKAFDIVRKKTQIKIRAFIIGDGEDRQKIEKLASELKIDFVDEKQSGKAAALTFTSWIRAVDWVLAGLDIVALTSDNEGTPVSLIEAQASNKPIVTTNAGGVEDTVVINKTALISDVGDVESFAENLLKLTVDNNLRNKMGKEGNKHVSDKFNFTRLVNDMELLYDKLLTEKPE